MSDEKVRLANQIYQGCHAESVLEDALVDAGVEFDSLGFDEYDSSIHIPTSAGKTVALCLSRRCRKAGATKLGDYILN